MGRQRDSKGLRLATVALTLQWREQRGGIVDIQRRWKWAVSCPHETVIAPKRVRRAAPTKRAISLYRLGTLGPDVGL